MEVVRDHDDARADVANAEQVAIKPILQLVARFLHAHRSNILDVVEDEHVGTVMLEAHAAHRLLDGNSRDLRVVFLERQGGGVPRGRFLGYRTEVILEHRVRLKLPLDRVNELLRLLDGLSDDQDEVFLLLAKNRPDGVRHRADRALRAPAERHRDRKPDLVVLRQIEEPVVDVCGWILDVVAEVRSEEGLVRLSREFNSRGLVVHHQIQHLLV